MQKDTRNRTDICFDALRSMDLDGLEGLWLLLVGGELVFAHESEGAVLEHARKHFPDETPCLAKAPPRHPCCL